MKIITGILLTLVTSTAFSKLVTLSPEESKAVIKGVGEMSSAFRKQNYEVSVNKMPTQFFTHFKTSKDTMLAVAKKSMAKLKELGFKVTELYPW